MCQMISRSFEFLLLMLIRILVPFKRLKCSKSGNLLALLSEQGWFMNKISDYIFEASMELEFDVLLHLIANDYAYDNAIYTLIYIYLVFV